MWPAAVWMAARLGQVTLDTGSFCAQPEAWYRLEQSCLVACFKVVAFGDWLVVEFYVFECFDSRLIYQLPPARTQLVLSTSSKIPPALMMVLLCLAPPKIDEFSSSTASRRQRTSKGEQWSSVARSVPETPFLLLRPDVWAALRSVFRSKTTPRAGIGSQRNGTIQRDPTSRDSLCGHFFRPLYAHFQTHTDRK